MSTQELFEKAAYYVKNAPAKDSSNEEKLKVYGLFKQASIGDVEGSQPWAVQVEARAKWDAWAANKGMSKEDAMKAYVALVTKDDADWLTGDVLKNYSK